MPQKGTRIAASAVGALAAAALAVPLAGAHNQYEPNVHSLPKPGGSANAIVPIPAPKKFFGFNDLSFLNKRRFVSAERVGYLASRAGANVVRYELAWKDVEPVRDRWNEHEWDQYLAIDRALAREGIRSLVVLSTTPPWARERGPAATCQSEHGCEHPPSTDELDHWREFAAEVARRLQNPIIETWNEPNISLFFKPTPSPKRYSRMHVAAYNAIKRASPRTPVLLGGMANTQTTDKSGGKVIRYSQRDYLKRIYPAVKGTFDGISLHPYPDHPTRRTRRSLISHAVHDARTIQERFNDRGNDLWITETGVSTTGPTRGTQGEQAKGLLASYRQLITMADVRAVLIHTLFDQTDAPPATRGYGSGIVAGDNPLRLKRAYCAFNGRSGHELIGNCKPRRDRGVPGARRAKKLGATCAEWLRPQPHYQRSGRTKRREKRARCKFDLTTIEVAKRGTVKKLRRRATRRASRQTGAFAASRGRAGIRLARKAVERLAHSGYL